MVSVHDDVDHRIDRHRIGFISERICQRQVAEKIGQARDSAAEIMNRRAGLVIEQGWHPADDTQAMADIGDSLGRTKRLEMIMDRNSLRELP